MEDIILVTGRHITRSWINIAFSENPGVEQVSFGVRVSGDSGAYLHERNVSGGQLKLGPSGEVSSKSYCILGNHALIMPNASRIRTSPKISAYLFEGTAPPAS